MATMMYQKVLGDTTWLFGAGPQAGSPEEVARRRRQAREKAARSKTGLWGPTHSMSSDEEEKETDDAHNNIPSTSAAASQSTGWFGSTAGRGSTITTTTPHHQNNTNTKATTSSNTSTPKRQNESQGTDSTKSSEHSLERTPPTRSTSYIGRVWNNAQSVLTCGQEDTTAKSVVTPEKKEFMEYVEDACSPQDDVCSPCHPRNLMTSDDHEPPLGICRLSSPNEKDAAQRVSSSVSISSSVETPADRRRQRHKQRQLRQSPPSPVFSKDGDDVVEVTPDKVMESNGNGNDTGNGNGNDKKVKMPVDTLTLDKKNAIELERSISELTMRSSYGQATAKLSENRRMAYYAVGRHHRQSGRGGNRRCYFTGKLILGGAPFYAGSVQQGLRTLVVFCLPSSLGLPHEHAASSKASGSVVDSLNGNSTHHSRRSQNLGGHQNPRQGMMPRRGSRVSRLSSMDDMSLSVEEELDPNWGLSREYLLKVLPEPKQALLDEMAVRYPAQFETLPVQVRSPPCWRLYVKFCFFSGLPIAEGEMHYKVVSDIADLYGEDIILSHEVMEAVNGDSAEILRLPNLKTFRYLRKHYNQQSTKLPDPVFQRQAWEMVRPEV